VACAIYAALLPNDPWLTSADDGTVTGKPSRSGTPIPSIVSHQKLPRNVGLHVCLASVHPNTLHALSCCCPPAGMSWENSVPGVLGAGEGLHVSTNSIPSLAGSKPAHKFHSHPASSGPRVGSSSQVASWHELLTSKSCDDNSLLGAPTAHARANAEHRCEGCRAVCGNKTWFGKGRLAHVESSDISPSVLDLSST